MDTSSFKREHFFVRRYDQNSKKKPKRSLTKSQKKHLFEKCRAKAVRAYVTRMRASGLIADCDEIEDIEQEAIIALYKALNRFDVSKMGRLAKNKNEAKQGANKPKSLDFYFMVYFYNSVNMLAADAATQKWRRGGYSSWYNKCHSSVLLDNEFEENKDLKVRGLDFESEIGLYIFGELNKHRTEFKDFVSDKIYLSRKELKKKYEPVDLKKFKTEFRSFAQIIKEKYKNVDLSYLFRTPRKKNKVKLCKKTRNKNNE